MRATLIALALVVAGGYAIAAATVAPMGETDANWSAPLNLTNVPTTQYSGYPGQSSVAVDGAGNVHVAWYTEGSVHQAWVRRYDAATSTWEPAVQVSNATGTEDAYRPSIACDNSGNAHVVWYGGSVVSYYGLWYTMRDVNTGLWSTPTRIFYNGSYYQQFADVVCTPGADNIHVVWKYRDATTGTIYQAAHMEYIPGSGWQAHTVLSTNSQDIVENISCAVSAANDVHVVWSQDPASGEGYERIWYIARTGGTWGSIEQVSPAELDGDYQQTPVVAVDAAGDVCAVWSGEEPGGGLNRILYRKRASGAWGDVEVASATDDDEVYPDVQASDDGRIHVLWAGWPSGALYRQLRFRSRGAAGWGATDDITNISVGSTYYPSLATRAGVMHAYWYDNFLGNNECWYSRGDPVPPPAPTQVAPPDGGDVTTFTPTLEVVDMAPSGVDKYHFRAWLDGVVEHEDDAVPANTWVTPGLINGETYEWDCAAHNPDGWGPFSGLWSFNVMVLPAVPVLVSPPDLAVDQPNHGTLEWEAAWNATGYDVYLDVVDPPLVMVSSNQPELEYDFHGLDNDKTYYWMVAARNAAGTTESDIWEFTTEKGLPDWPDGWSETGSHIPTANSGRNVKRGGWMTLGPNGNFYLAKGYKTGDFYRYDPIGDSFSILPDIEMGSEGKLPEKGCRGVYDGDHGIYMTKGNNTLGFWHYDITGRAWTQLGDIPEGPTGKKVKGGTDLVWVERPQEPGYVYMLKGYKTEFWRYNTETGQWEPRANAPDGIKDKWDKGSWLVADIPHGQGHGQRPAVIYAHKAKYYTGSEHEFYRYDIERDSWSTALSGMPLYGWHSGTPNRKKKAKDGGAGAYYADGGEAGQIYALKGGNTQQFFMYDVKEDTWTEKDTIPTSGSSNKKRRVKVGGDFVHWDSRAFFAMKGNKTLEMWRYVIPAMPARTERGGVMAGTVKGLGTGIQLGPNPLTGGIATLRYSLPKAGAATVRVFDVTGRTVVSRSLVATRSGVVNLDLRSLSAGIYLVRFDAGDYSAAHKLVIQH